MSQPHEIIIQRPVPTPKWTFPNTSKRPPANRNRTPLQCAIPHDQIFCPRRSYPTISVGFSNPGSGITLPQPLTEISQSYETLQFYAPSKILPKYMKHSSCRQHLPDDVIKYRTRYLAQLENSIFATFLITLDGKKSFSIQFSANIRQIYSFV